MNIKYLILLACMIPAAVCSDEMTANIHLKFNRTVFKDKYKKFGSNIRQRIEALGNKTAGVSDDLVCFSLFCYF